MPPAKTDRPSAIKSLDPPETVRSIAKRLEDAGFETWCVGGAVRDALLGHAHLDWDLATAAKPPEVRRLFKRTVPVGVEFGTIGVLDHDNVMHEVTTFRKDVTTDGRHAVVEFGASLDDDLARHRQKNAQGSPIFQQRNRVDRHSGRAVATARPVYDQRPAQSRRGLR